MPWLEGRRLIRSANSGSLQRLSVFMLPFERTHTAPGQSTYPADDTLPVGASVSGFELVRQTLEVIHPEAVVTWEDVAWQVTLEAVPVVALPLPLLQGETQHSTSLGDPPHSNLLATAGEGTAFFFYFLPPSSDTSSQVYRLDIV